MKIFDKRALSIQKAKKLNFKASFSANNLHFSHFSHFGQPHNVSKSETIFSAQVDPVVMKVWILTDSVVHYSQGRTMLRSVNVLIFFTNVSINVENTQEVGFSFSCKLAVQRHSDHPTFFFYSEKKVSLVSWVFQEIFFPSSSSGKK